MASTMAEGQNANCKQPEKRAQEVERIQADESRQAKISQAHSAQDAVFIAVRNDEATQAKEKINREETMTYKILAIIRVSYFHKMEGDNS